MKAFFALTLPIILFLALQYGPTVLAAVRGMQAVTVALGG